MLQRLHIGAFGNENFLGLGVVGVVLHDKADKRLVFFLVNRRDGKRSLQQFSVADKEAVKANIAFVFVITKHVAGRPVRKINRLLFLDVLDMLDLVPQLLRALELQLLGRVLHFKVQIVQHNIHIAL